MQCNWQLINHTPKARRKIVIFRQKCDFAHFQPKMERYVNKNLNEQEIRSMERVCQMLLHSIHRYRKIGL